MKKTKKIMKLTTLLLISVFTFFIGYIKYDAADYSFLCKYALGDDYKVEVTIAQGKADAYYYKWGDDWKDKSGKGNHEKVPGYKRNYDDERNWDRWIYDNQKCPEYILAAKLPGWNGDLANVFFSNTGNSSYNEANYRNAQQNLKLTEQLTDHALPNPRPVSSLLFKDGGSNATFEIANAKNGIINSITIESGTTRHIIVKTANDTLGAGSYMTMGKLSCHSESSDIVSSVSSMIWNFSPKGVLPNYTAARFYIKGNKVGTTNIQCTYTNDDGGTVTGNLSVTVTDPTTNRTYNQKDLTCNYMASYGDRGQLGSIRVKVKDYNDGYNSNPTITYERKSNGNSWFEHEYDKEFDQYEFWKSGDYKMEFYCTKTEFKNALQQSGGCPPLYVSVYNGLTGKYYQIKTTGTGNNFTRISPDGGQATTVNNGCDFVIKDPATGDTVTTVTFIKSRQTGSSGYRYSYVINNSETSIGSSIQTLSKELTVSYSAYMQTKHKYTFEKAFLTDLFNNHYSDCSAPANSCVIKGSSSVTTQANLAITTIPYTITNDTAQCNTAASDDNNSTVADVDNTTVQDGTEPNQTPGGGRTDELELFQADNSGANLSCTDLFGSEGSRNDLYNILHTVIIIIRIGTPIFLILLTMLDFTKATAVDEALPKAKKNAIIRGITAIIIFLLPSLLNLVFIILGMESCAI